ncbi:hypothetical protein CXP20_25640, partial [Salmonella enterica subsp. enterica serovar Newport]
GPGIRDHGPMRMRLVSAVVACALVGCSAGGGTSPERDHVVHAVGKTERQSKCQCYPGGHRHPGDVFGEAG